jgi:hypothetical protein
MMRLLTACCCPIQTDSDSEMSDSSDEGVDRTKDAAFMLRVSFKKNISQKNRVDIFIEIFMYIVINK